MADFRQITTSRNLSETALELIENAKAKGTRSCYRSAWNKFNGWCSGKQINPTSCPVENILNYLSVLFEQGMKYRTINSHRSAISHFHNPIEGFKAGQHPTVCKLLKGISRARPSQPRYTFIWDVEVVLKKMRELPANSKLPLSTLSFKLVTLLGLLSPSRGSELIYFDINSMGTTPTQYEFFLEGTVKHSKQGMTNPSIKYHAFQKETKLCPIETITIYLQRTKEYRQRHNTTKLWLSYAPPHKPISKTTLTRWVTSMLAIGGVNTNRFKPHSLRAASTSKGFQRGISISDILKRGNWSNESVWQTYYHKEISPTESYQRTLLDASN